MGEKYICINFADKKYRRVLVKVMIIKGKNNSKRRESHSRQHHSNLRSHSRSTQKHKQRSNSKLILKMKPTQHSHDESSQGNSARPVLTGHALRKNNSSKQIDTSNQYYSHFKGKSKSRGKLHAPLDDTSKVKYLNSVYMHKEAQVNSTSEHIQDVPKQAEPAKTEKEQVVSNPALLNKIKMLERNCGIDANGRIIPKETVKAQYYESSKNMDSQNTISIFEGERKKEKRKVRDKTRKEMLKGARSKREERGSEVAKLAAVKSSEKCMKKKDTKEVYSPSCLGRQEVESELGQTLQSFKMKDKPKLRAKAVSNSRTVANKTLLEETRTSPNQGLETPLRTHQLPNHGDVLKELEEDNKVSWNHRKLKIIYGSELLQERVKVIEFLGRLCASLAMRREAHSLAIYYMDKYIMTIEKEVTPKQLKLIAMTALLLALKIDDGIMSRKLCHEYINHMESVLQMGGREGRGKSSQKNKDIASAFSSRDSSGSVAKAKSQSGHSTYTELGVREDGKKTRKQQVVHSKEMTMILSLQLDMMVKFGFKLVARSSTYWVDVLTSLWDSYLLEEMEWEQDLMFRSDRNKRNISHLFQVIQKVQSSVDVYQFSVPAIVLSSMYLIVRMQLEEQKERHLERKIYAKFVQNFSKSANLIFYDSVGVNQFFGDFLETLDMDISHLTESIRFVGRNLDQNMKVFQFNAKSKYIDRKNYQHQLSIYEDSNEGRI